jgi:hypothetical protein
MLLGVADRKPEGGSSVTNVSNELLKIVLGCIYIWLEEDGGYKDIRVLYQIINTRCNDRQRQRGIKKRKSIG